MKYKVYKLKFLTAVHFGNGSLEDVDYTFCADTLFSALCQEASKLENDSLQELYRFVREGKLIFSDAFPYRGETYYLPKPMKRIERENQEASSLEKKAYKKLKYIAVEDFQSYLEGRYEILKEDKNDSFGNFDMKVAASIRGEEETKPYRIGQFFFKDDCGLYFVIGYKENQDLYLVEELLENLTYSGIGGKRTSGLGRFELFTGKIPPELLKRLTTKGTTYMSLSVALPKEEELETAMQEADYLLLKRSGFVSSDTFAKEHMRKKDLYVFKAGSCFKTVFSGDVYDVSGHKGAHPVYRYAKPMFMEVSV